MEIFNTTSLLKKACSVIAAILLITFPLLAQELLKPGVTPDGSIAAMEEHDGKLYIGGSFDRVGYQTGGAAMFHGDAIKPDLEFPHIDGEVYSIIEDGAGGWYIGGEFDRVGAAPRSNVVHILSDYTIDPAFNPNLNDKVNVLKRRDDMLYLGGKFTQAEGNNQKYVAVYDLNTNTFTSFNPEPNGEVKDMEVYDDFLFIGGFFTQIAGVSQAWLARLALSDGQNIPLSFPFTGQVYDLLAMGDSLLVGGSFPGCVAAVNLTDDSIVDWGPEITGFGPRVNSLTLLNSILYLGGSFSTVDGEARKNVAGYSMDGDITAFQPDPNAEVFRLEAWNDSLFITGDFTVIAGADLPHIAKIDPVSGNPAPFKPMPGWAGHAIMPFGNSLLIGGEFDMFQIAERDGACAIDIATGEVVNWDPATDFLTVSSLKIDTVNNVAYLGGFDSNTLRHFKAFDLTTGAELAGWEFEFDGQVYAIDVDQTTGTVYLGGAFTAINGESHDKIAGVSPAGDLISLNVSIDDAVYDVAFSPDHEKLYFGGEFELVNSEERLHIAAVNKQGELQDWHPELKNDITLPVAPTFILPQADRVYLAGNVEYVNDEVQKRLAAVDPISGDLLAFDPQVEGASVFHLENAGNGIFLCGGNITSAGGEPASNLAYIGQASGLALETIPPYGFENTNVFTMALNDSLLFLGGSVFILNGQYYGYLARVKFDISDVPTPPGGVTVEKASPEKGGNTGDVTIKIIGSGFVDGITVKLTGDGFEDIRFKSDSSVLYGDNELLASFDLRGAELGTRNIEILAPGGMLLVLEDAFEIEAGVGAQPWADVVAPYFVTTNKEEFFYLSFGNKGNIDAVGVPVWLAVSPNISVKDISFRKIPIFDPEDPLYDSIPEFIVVDSLAGKPYNAKVYGFIIPRIEASGSKMVRFTIKGSENGTFYTKAWAGRPFYGSPLKYAVGECADTWISNAVGFIPVVGCAYGLADAALTPIFDYFLDPDFGSWDWAGNYMELVASTAVGCAADAVTGGFGGAVIEIVDQSLKAKSTIDLWMKCWPPEDKENAEGEFVASCDPNDKSGLTGKGEKGWINTRQRFPYMIRFENEPEATAPAKEVIIRDSLDVSVFDVRALELKGFAIADSFYSIPAGYRDYTDTIDLQPRLPYLVESAVDLNETTGLLTWSFTTLDPGTKDPVTDPIGGFLPPNADTLSGQGAIFFDLAVYDTLTSGREISNKAAIYFDFNEPIITNTWRLAADNGGISSSVKALEETQPETTIQLEWSGADEGSGILYYDVFVRKDGGEWLYAAVQTSALSMDFAGEPGSTYEFYTVAFDSALNVEQPPFQPDARVEITTGVTGLPQLAADGLSVYPNPARAVVNIQGKPSRSNLNLRLYNLSGQALISWPSFKGETINIGFLPPGMYILKWQGARDQGHVKLVKR